MARQISKGKVVKLAPNNTEVISMRENRFGNFVVVALLLFGIYQSVLYFGHKVVPISDFPTVVRPARELLSLKVPSSFKYAPVVGLLQVFLSNFIGGNHPDLVAGWLLNALLHPFSVLLFWLVGKRVIGKDALWLAVIASLNPWVMYMLREPLIETVLLFFTLLTFFLIFKRSRWCYLFASIAALVRYEGAALIAAAFVMDMIYAKDKRERIQAFLYSIIASVPLGIWLLGTVLSWDGGSSHYFNVMSKEYSKNLASPLENRTGLLLHMKLAWRVGFMPLLMPWFGASKDVGQMIWQLSKFFVLVSFFFGSIYGLCKRQWKILALLIFFVPYFLLHARYPYPLQRYHTNIFWIVLFISWYGFQSGRKLIHKDGRVPKQIVFVFQALILVIAGIWLFALAPYLSKAASISPRSASLPCVAMVLVGLIFAGRMFVYKGGYLLREICILVLMCLVITSNQFSLVRLLGDGQQDKEFKVLADWYITNSNPGEKLVVYMDGVTRIFAPKRAKDIGSFPGAENPGGLVKALYEREVTYVVWASREGLNPVHTGYRKLKLDKNIAFLREPKDIGPYQFMTQLGSKRGFVNVFRLRKPTGMMKRESPDG